MDIEVIPYYAYFNSIHMYIKYLKSEMDYNRLKKASTDLMLYYIDDLKSERPAEYICPQLSEIITIDENCNVLTCCGMEKGMKDYSIGNLFNLSLKDIEKLKKKQEICNECLDLRS